jgi:hypothetical protein
MKCYILLIGGKEPDEADMLFAKIPVNCEDVFSPESLVSVPFELEP